MKPILLLLILPWVSLDTDFRKLSAEFSQSLLQWQEFKKKTGNTYHYQVESTSPSGLLAVTTIIVESGSITGRHFMLFKPEGTEKHLLTDWIENKDEIGLHTVGSANAITLDNVYEIAASTWLKADKKKNELHFEAKNEGLISVCGYTPLNSEDNEMIGIRITAIKAGVPSRDITSK